MAIEILTDQRLFNTNTRFRNLTCDIFSFSQRLAKIILPVWYVRYVSNDLFAVTYETTPGIFRFISDVIRRAAKC